MEFSFAFEGLSGAKQPHQNDEGEPISDFETDSPPAQQYC
jgi:hypothetical protein